MAVQIIKRPETTITGSFKSTWVSAVHPVLFELQCEVADELTRPNYRIIIEAFEVGTNTKLAKTVNRPFTNGRLEVDLQSYLEQFLLNKDDVAYLAGAVNQKDIGKSVQFYISYQEVHDDPLDPLAAAIEHPSVIDTGRYFACIAKKQIGDAYGQNMADFVPVKATVPDDKKAKFLTRLPKPVYFEGWPFSLSFIYDVNMKDIQASRVEVRYDHNRQAVSDSVQLLSRDGVGFINRLYLKGDYEFNVTEVDVTMNTGQQVASGYIDSGFVEAGYVEEGDVDVNV